MEAPWAQQLRLMARRHKKTVIDATINDQNHIVLKTADDKEIDAGFIKEKPAGSIVYYGQVISDLEPEVYLSKDGEFWVAGASQGRFLTGAGFADSGCWTGDRFLVGLQVEEEVG